MSEEVRAPVLFPVNSLHGAIERVHADHPGLDRDEIAAIVRAAASLMAAELAPLQRSLLLEVAELGCAVSAARDEIARLRREGALAENPIPEAADELDAIVEHTASATETILDASEAIDMLAVGLAAHQSAALQEQTTRIFEACSFQDITGQRISKVVAALKMVEARIARIVGSYVPGVVPSPAPAAPARDPLLNGPQQPHAAMDQDEIDRLLTF